MSPERQTDVDIQVHKVGTPGADLILAIQADNSDEPDNSDIETATIAESTVQTSAGIMSIYPDTPPSLTSTNKYWMVFRCDDVSGDFGSNSYKIGIKDASSYTDGKSMRTLPGGLVWVDTSDGTDDFWFETYFDNSAGTHSIVWQLKYKARYR